MINSPCIGAYIFHRWWVITNGSSYIAEDFVTGFGVDSVVHLRFGPYQTTQALYYTTFANGGQVRRIRYTGLVNQAPVASITASPRFGALPLSVRFDASASSDPEGQALSYSWNFGDGNTAIGPVIQHVYTEAGPFTARLTVEDTFGARSTRTLKMFPDNTQPVPVITSPSVETRFGVGDIITLTADATNAQDGVIPENQVYWQVLIRHDDHTHPYVGITYGKTLTL
jgi:PKD repeat protein